MTELQLPEPLTPPDCDLRDFAFMPLDVARLRDSDLAIKLKPRNSARRSCCGARRGIRCRRRACRTMTKPWRPWPATGASSPNGASTATARCTAGFGAVMGVCTTPSWLKRRATPGRPSTSMRTTSWWTASGKPTSCVSSSTSRRGSFRRLRTGLPPAFRWKLIFFRRKSPLIPAERAGRIKSNPAEILRKTLLRDRDREKEIKKI